MKLYGYPGSTSSRPVIWFLNAHNIAYDMINIDLMTGEQFKEPYKSINPASTVPAIDDNGFILTESKAILQYLATKYNSSWYSNDLKQRARIDQALYYCHAELYWNLMYYFVYPQVLPHLSFEKLDTKHELYSRSRQWSKGYLKHVNDFYLGQGKPFLAGSEMSIADAMLSSILSAAELVNMDYSNYPNIESWFSRIKAMDKWQESNAGVYYWKDMVKGMQFESFEQL